MEYFVEPDPRQESGRFRPHPAVDKRSNRIDGFRSAEGEGTAEAITRFYAYAAPRIVAVLVSSVGATVEEASEAAHNSIVEAAQSWDAIRTSPLSWCITVARRYWGRRKYSAEASFDDVSPNSPLLKDVSQDVVRRVESRLRLNEAIKRLPLLTPRERDVLDLHLAGLAASEIGTHLKCAEPTVRVHLANIRSKLDGNASASDKGGRQ